MPQKASKGQSYPIPTKEARLLVQDVTERLEKSADPKAKTFIERYLKTVESRGNKVPAIKAPATATLKAAPCALSSDIYSAAFLLLLSKFTDDKYAGLMFMSRRLILSGAIFEPPNVVLRDRLLDDVSALFDSGVVDNWSECDGLCGHVIGPFVARHPHRSTIADSVLHTVDDVLIARHDPYRLPIGQLEYHVAYRDCILLSYIYQYIIVYQL